jgi:hypothetical protein
MALPTVDEVVAYLGDGANRWTSDGGDTYPAIAEELEAETSAQSRMCDYGSPYPDELKLALLRRVQRALQMRSLPLAVLQGDSDTGNASFLPSRDPEIRRREAPYRRLVGG